MSQIFRKIEFLICIGKQSRTILSLFARKKSMILNYLKKVYFGLQILVVEYRRVFVSVKGFLFLLYLLIQILEGINYRLYYPVVKPLFLSRQETITTQYNSKFVNENLKVRAVCHWGKSERFQLRNNSLQFIVGNQTCKCFK